MMGVDTVLADDPMLTDRSGLRRRRPLLRVVLDSALRMPLDSKMVKRRAERRGDLYRFEGRGARLRELQATRGVRVEVLPARGGPRAAGQGAGQAGRGRDSDAADRDGHAAEYGAAGGGLVDRVHLFVSPQIMGSDAVPAFRGMTKSIRMAEVEVERYENDLGLCSLLRDPWPEKQDKGDGTRGHWARDNSALSKGADGTPNHPGSVSVAAENRLETPC